MSRSVILSRRSAAKDLKIPSSAFRVPSPSSRLRMTAVALLLAAGCATTTRPAAQGESLHGVASWYGQEYAGRTTANGEIFDPMLLTAAHRTLPFGTVVEVKNAKTSQTVRVRINDRGPYVGNRLIDLSYAAAQQIGLIEPGSGDVDLIIVQLGKGEREPPAPYSVTVAENTPPPRVEQPAIVDQVKVIETHHGVDTRRQVAADGKTIETVPVRANEQRSPAPAAPVPRLTGRFVVQVGAFADTKNANALQQKLHSEGFDSFIDHGPVLYKVQIGPFETREQALRTRERLEAAGISAMIVMR